MLDRIRDGRTDLLFDLLAAGHTADCADEGGVRLIQWCAYYGDVSGIRYLTAQGETLAALGPDRGLNAAAFHGHWQLCEYLIESGADPNFRDDESGETPLHSALSRANGPAQDRVVRVLLSAGADPAATTIEGAETGCFMRDVRTRGETPLHRAAAFAGEQCIDMLLECGARREARDMHGDSPLSWASLHLRPATIIRRLCFGDHRIDPAADWTGDHGTGASGMDIHLLGTPHGGTAV